MRPKFKQCCSPFMYKPPVTMLIQNLKYNNRQYLADTLGNFLVQSYIFNGYNCDLIVNLRYLDEDYMEMQLLDIPVDIFNNHKQI